MFIKTGFIFLLLFFVSPIYLLANANGIALNQSRIIFSAKDNSQVAQVRNETNDAFLIQATVLKAVEGKAVNNFIVTPPLFKIEPKSEYSTRVVPNNINELPKDRESIFYFKIRAIPAVKKKDDENKIGMVFVTAIVIKMFYRPNGIEEPKFQDYEKLTLINNKEGWQFYNPTPYYMTVVDFNINGLAQGNSLLISPYSYYKIDGDNIKDGRVSWRLLNDFGASTERFVFNPHVKTGIKNQL